MFYNNANRKINELNKKVDKSRIIEISYILGSRREIIKRNLLAGIFRGIGIGIGVTIITAIMVYFLQKIIRLNIPIISDYITDIVEIVQKNLH